MNSIIPSKRESQERFNQELPRISPKKSFSMVKSNIFQTSQNSQQSIHKKATKSQVALETLLNTKLRFEGNTSPESTIRKSFRQDKQSCCTFFPSKKGMMQSQYLDVSNQLKSLSYKDNNLMQILAQISFIINELNKYKSEKSLLSLIEKEIVQNSRFQELSFLFLNAKLKDLVSADSLFRIIYKQFTYIQDNRTIVKKSKMESLFLQLLWDFLYKLEELYRKVNETQFQGLQESMRSSRLKLQNKEIEVQRLFASNEKRESLHQLQQFQKLKFSINKRILESKLSEDINAIEEKNGQFKYIDKNNRYISNKIDDILKNIQ